MKKLIAFLLTILMVLSLAACSKNNYSTDSDIFEPKSSTEDTDSNEDENDRSTVPENWEGAENTQT